MWNQVIFNELPLERVKTNPYNKYWNKIIPVKNYRISIQGNSHSDCTPKENYENPFMYSEYELFITENLDLVIPMGYKEHFDTNGIAKYVPKEIVIKILKYIQSPICIMMDLECI